MHTFLRGGLILLALAAMTVACLMVGNPAIDSSVSLGPVWLLVGVTGLALGVIVMVIGGPHGRRTATATVLAAALIVVSGCSNSAASTAGSTAPATSTAVAQVGTSGEAAVSSDRPAAAISTSGSPEPTSAVSSDQTAAAASTTGSPDPTSAVSSEVPSPVTTPVSPPTMGDINQTIATSSVVAESKVGLRSIAHSDAGVSAQLSELKSIETSAQFPGEIAGPGVAVTIRIQNSSTKSIDLDNSIVDLRGANGAPAIQVTGAPASPLRGTLTPGSVASGVYVFTIPLNQRNPISVRFSYSASAPTVLFVGDAQ